MSKESSLTPPTNTNEQEIPLPPALKEWKMIGERHGSTHYLLRGKKNDPSWTSQPVVICVHGIGSYYVTWNRLASDLLKHNYIVVQYDLIGRGFSEPSINGKYGEEEHIQQLHELLEGIKEQLPPPPYHFICHSMGGSLGTIFTSRYPAFVRSLTLLSPAGLMGYYPVGLLHSVGCLESVVKPFVCNDEQQLQAIKNDFYTDTEDSLAMQQVYLNNARIQTVNNPNAREAFWRSVLEFPLRNIDEHVQNIGKRQGFPVHLLWAKEDKAVPYNPDYFNWLNYLQAKEENPEIVCELETKVYENTAHAFFLEFPSMVHRDILTFLAAR